ncbi:MAG TPA: SpoIIE family protein phosphatase [Stenomitos sp.]
METEQSSPGSPRPPRRRERVGLQTKLRIAFLSVAILPALVGLALQLQSSEQNLLGVVRTVTNLGRTSLEGTSEQIADSSVQNLTRTSDQLIKLSQESINKTSDELMHVSQDKLQGASRQVIDLSLETNHQVAQGMVGLSKEAAGKLSSELIDLSKAANSNLSQTTSAIAERAVEGNTDRLIAINERLADELSDYLEKTNQQTAKAVSQGLLTELEREPLVNFRILAQVMAQTFAGGKLVDRNEAYVTVINRKGNVQASTRYRRATPLQHLEIVQRALNDPPELAAQTPLITYRDGKDTYMGVYARRNDGGAVIISYNLAKAQSDLESLGKLVNGSFDHLVKTTTAGTREAISTSTPRIKSEAAQLTRDTIRTIKAESERVSRQSAEQMAHRATQISHAYEADMTAQARSLTHQAASLMHDSSQQVIERALNEMAPIGKRSAQQAVAAMEPQAQRAVDRIKKQLPARIRQASTRAADRMLPAADVAVQSSRLSALTMALGILALSALAGIVVSYRLSKQIADPIEVQEKLQQAELDRMGKEMEIATRIQTALIPSRWEITDYDLSMGLITATEVGGDLIDYLPGTDGQFWLAVGDVTGHGLTPGLVMMMAQSILTSHVMATPDASPSAILTWVNAALHQNVKYRLHNDNYMTLQLLHHLGDGRFVAAGMHLDVLIHRCRTGQVERIDVPGFWTGFLQLDDISILVLRRQPVAIPSEREACALD